MNASAAGNSGNSRAGVGSMSVSQARMVAAPSSVIS